MRARAGGEREGEERVVDGDASGVEMVCTFDVWSETLFSLSALTAGGRPGWVFWQSTIRLGLGIDHSTATISCSAQWVTQRGGLLVVAADLGSLAQVGA